MSGPPPGFENFASSPFTFENFDATEEVVLENAWCFWHDKFIGPGLSVAEYEASLHKLCTFKTVQDFWKCFNNLPTVEKLKPKSSFHMMKDGISPLWEDPKNVNGGFWVMRVNKDNIANVWKELVLAVIGEQFDPVMGDSDEICGLTISIRQYDDIIRLWTNNASAKTQALLSKVQDLVPNVELRNPYYKANQEHQAFSKEFVDKKKSLGHKSNGVKT
eukprot:CAMPEP_0174258300 /NCGR_PEP_ID=MMETSP0439-20130205/7315_1 /TAXON_ID=0 /ORGANISM="Stereomyxa ramosa, Strain Chinc5" /LENGTH=217 /DNA_ID=CAMNT_0015341755 /DNA_START=31 /DNA_END=684 /DNA_ORIENTATION=-